MMIEIIFGENYYESKRYLDSILNERYSNCNIKQIDAEYIQDSNEIFGNTQPSDLFGQKQVLVVKRLFKNKSAMTVEKIIEVINQGKTEDIIFWEDGNIDKRKKFYKNINKKVFKLAEFENFKIDKLIQWSAKKSKELNLNLTTEQLSILIGNSNNNQSVILSELNKIKLYKDSIGSVSKKEFYQILSENKSYQIWDLISSIEKNKKAEKQMILNKLLKQGEQPIAIMGMLARHIRILILSRYLIERKNAGPQDLQKTLGLAPFVAKKAYDSSRLLGFERLKRYYDKLMRTDLAIKEGKLDPELALVMFVAIL